MVKMEEVSWMDDFKISGNLSIYNVIALKKKGSLICMLWGVKVNAIVTRELQTDSEPLDIFKFQ